MFSYIMTPLMALEIFVAEMFVANNFDLSYNYNKKVIFLTQNPHITSTK